jgi:hypothetical protein
MGYGGITTARTSALAMGGPRTIATAMAMGCAYRKLIRSTNSCLC